MKKIICLVLSVFIVFQFCLTAFADDSVEIYCDDVTLSTEEQTLIPINIKNNQGIMGFKITVNYQADKIDIKSVSRGAVTSKGNFNTNFGMNTGEFDVVWNNVSQIKTDGTLFVLSAVANRKVNENIKINLSFSQPDTFNEKYEDVKFNCKDIVILSSENSSTQTTKEKNNISETKNTSAKNEEVSDINSSDDIANNKIKTTTASKSAATENKNTTIENSQIIDAVKITLEQNKLQKIEDVSDEEKFIEDFNKNILKITGSDEYKVTDFSTVENMFSSAYEGQFVAEITNNIDNNKISDIITNELKKYNVSSFNKLKGKEKSKMIFNIEKEMKKIDPNTPNISSELNDDEAIKIIEKIYDMSGKSEVSKRNHNNVNKWVVIICIVLGIIIVFAFLANFLKNRRKINKE